MTRRVMRIRNEAVIAAATYTAWKRASMDDKDGSWVIFWDFVLPPGHYSQSVCNILLQLPPSYPFAAPDFFWTDPGLRTADGRMPQHYFEELEQYEREAKNGWATCSLHLRTWRPHFDPARGHNLSTLCRLIDEAFRRWTA